MNNAFEKKCSAGDRNLKGKEESIGLTAVICTRNRTDKLHRALILVNGVNPRVLWEHRGEHVGEPRRRQEPEMRDKTAPRLINRGLDIHDLEDQGVPGLSATHIDGAGLGIDVWPHRCNRLHECVICTLYLPLKGILAP